VFIPFIFTMDVGEKRFGNYHFWVHFYWYSIACIKNDWPIISHERYFERFSCVEENVFGCSLHDYMSVYGVDKIPTTNEMMSLKKYSITQTEEDALIAQYESTLDCWIDLLGSDNVEFENIIGVLLDKITDDYKEAPEGVLIYEYLPKGLLAAANKRGIPVIFQAGGIIRPPMAKELNAFSLINEDSYEFIYERYKNFVNESTNIPMLPRKGLLRLLTSEFYLKDIHNIDNEPEYEAGVLLNNSDGALLHVGQKYITDWELCDRVKEKHKNILIRARPWCEPTVDAQDDSPTCFHFCCKCEKVAGFSTKGMFEAMLAGRAAHEYGSFFFHSFCNDGIEDSEKGIAPIEFINFVLFGLCAPIEWLTDPEYLRFLLSNPSEKEIYMRTFEAYTRRLSRDDMELYYSDVDAKTKKRTYRLGDMLYFSSGHKPHESASYYCTGGLCDYVSNCTWSDGDCTSFEFDLFEPGNEQLTISIALHDVAVDVNLQNPSQTIFCEINGVDCGSIVLTKISKIMRFKIPIVCNNDKLRIKFTYKCLYDQDGFKFGVAFERMYISCLDVRTIGDAMFDEIMSLAGRVDEQTCEIMSLAGKVVKQANEVEGLTGIVAEKTSTIADQTGIIAGQVGEIAVLTGVVTEQARSLTGLTDIITQQASEITGLSGKVSEQTNEIIGLSGKVSEQANEITTLASKNVEYETLVTSIYSSRSWRLGNSVMRLVSKVFRIKKSR
jgi:hypothetical protein